MNIILPSINELVMGGFFISFLFNLYQFYKSDKLYKDKMVSDIFDNYIGIAISRVKLEVAKDISNIEKKKIVMDYIREHNKKDKNILSEYDISHIVDIAYNTYVKPSRAK